MSDSRTLAERIAACCPCAIAGQNQCSANVWRCACIREGRMRKNRPGIIDWPAEQDLKCLWPGHAVEAEVEELERDKMGAEYDAGLERARADEAEMRAEAAEALLTEAPNPGYGQNAQRWTDEEYWPWWKRIRATATK